MKIEMDVNEEDLGKTVIEILKGLNSYDRKAVAQQVMREWLNEPYDAERNAEEARVVREILEKKDGYGGAKTEEEARKGYQFREKMQKFVSSKEEMVKTVTEEVIGHYKAEVGNLIRNDPAIQRMKQEVSEIVKENFPKMVHGAMIAWFADHTNTILGALGNAVNADQMRELGDRLQNQLTEVANRQ